VTEVGAYLSGIAAPDAQIFFGLYTDPALKDEAEVIVIATHLAPGAGGNTGSALDLLRSTVPMYAPDGDVPPFVRMN
ncbi:MAG: FtsZ family, C-terminal domain, partial [Dehalococcoidia bacterium]|nr:FtsZ family, C-terminal domain [Dehalococcoidia bacterium]